MSLGYVKKKADSRALKAKTDKNLKTLDDRYDFEDIPANKNNADPSSQSMNKMTVKTKDGKELGHIEYDDTMFPDTIWVNDMQNYRIETGVGRAAIVKLMQKLPDKRLAWVSISEGSTKSYKKFCEEYPELAKKVDFNENIDIIDKSNKDIYNSRKGVVNEDTLQGSKQSGRSNKDLFETNKNTSSNDDRLFGTASTEQTPLFGSSRGEHSISSSSGSEQALHNASDINQQQPINKQRGVGKGTEQPISERLTATDGDLNEVDNIVAETVAKDTELSGTTWKDLAENAEELYEKLEAYGMKNLEALKGAFKTGDVDFVNSVTAKALAAERLVGNLREQAAAVMKQNGDITEIAESLAYLSAWQSSHFLSNLIF